MVAGKRGKLSTTTTFPKPASNSVELSSLRSSSSSLKENISDASVTQVLGSADGDHLGPDEAFDGVVFVDFKKSFNHQPPKVEIISHCFIKPQIISRESQEPIYFSPWDLAMLNINYIQKGLLFRKPENQDFSIAAFLQDQKDSLSPSHSLTSTRSPPV
ncbi:hypothetical protein OSB04_005914 [Centaurea solstitialis]|uniref:Uncharacterized protein n=1 Tax=Centaurea solstitialis TaxID=347529 RepID=A0AA38TIN7_9ASTR|nr:hypothetical protein OSB04_005914 [Centaurea solstitialis]